MGQLIKRRHIRKGSPILSDRRTWERFKDKHGTIWYAYPVSQVRRSHK